MLYHRTKDPLYVSDFLGHKSIKNPEKYVHIEKMMYDEGANNPFIVEVADAKIAGHELFRKRK